MIIKLFDAVGKYAENKDTARDIRNKFLLPALEKKEKIFLDFEGVETTTQSFIHALISEAMKKHGNGIFDYVVFKSCNDSIKQFVKIVVDYMQEALG